MSTDSLSEFRGERQYNRVLRNFWIFQLFDFACPGPDDSGRARTFVSNGRPAKQGIGLVAMRERSELMGGQIIFSTPAPGGTLLRLIVSRERVELREKDPK